MPTDDPIKDSFADGSPFWQFSLAFYGPDTAPACLALQDGCGVDVNVMLYLLWRAHRGEALGRPTIMGLEESIAPWRSQVVVPLRAVRRWMKEAAGAHPEFENAALRSAIKKNELAAEKHQQESLYAMTANFKGRSAEPLEAAEANLDTYAACLETTFPTDARAALLARFRSMKP